MISHPTRSKQSANTSASLPRRLQKCFEDLALDNPQQGIIDRAIHAQKSVDTGAAKLAATLDRNYVAQSHKYLESEESALRQINRFTEAFNKDPKKAKEELKTDYEIHETKGNLGAF